MERVEKSQYLSHFLTFSTLVLIWEKLNLVLKLTLKKQDFWFATSTIIILFLGWEELETHCLSHFFNSSHITTYP